MKIQHENAVELAKEMFWLAWQACGGPVGMGTLRDRPGVTKEDIWEQITGQVAGDYLIPQGKAGEPYGDYVFGRMMKMGLTVTADYVEFHDGDIREDYQAWSRKYPSYEALAKHAIENLEKDGRVPSLHKS